MVTKLAQANTVYGSIFAVAAVGSYLFILPTGTVSEAAKYFLAVNIATFILFGLDKIAARWQLLRAPERLLYAIALLGGSPAILAGMPLFRHKTLDGRFQLALTLVFVFQLALVRVFF